MDNTNQKINFYLATISILISYFGICLLFSSYSIHTLPLIKEYTFNSYEFPPNKNYDSITTQLDNHLKYIKLGDLEGPESIAFNSRGDLFFALVTSEIRYIKAPIDLNQNTVAETYPFSFTGGRPLGITFDADDNLIIADSLKGLLKVDRDTRDITILTSSVNGTKLNYLNDLVIDSRDGMIYFTDSTEIPPLMDKNGNWNTLYPSIYTCGAMLTSGKFLSYNPKTKETKVLMSGFTYSNGVTMDDESVYIAETCKCRIIKYWIRGENAGKSKVLVDSINGFPDGILFHNNKLYISIFGQRLKFYDIIQKYSILKRLYFAIPYKYTPKSKPSLVVADGKSGEILTISKCSIVNTITSTTIRDGVVYFGNLLDNYIAYLEK